MCGAQAHQLFSCSAAASQRAQQMSTVHLVDPLLVLLGHVRVFEPQLATLIALGELYQSGYLRQAADGRPRRERVKTIDL